MMTPYNLQNVKQAAHYYEKDDYYTKSKSPSAWWGKTAELLGLKGKVDRSTFQEALSGKLPDGTVMPEGHGGKRRADTDLTFSAPKSVRLMALVAGDERIIKAHQQAVTQTLEYLQRTTSNARLTKDGKTESETTGNLSESVSSTARRS